MHQQLISLFSAAAQKLKIFLTNEIQALHAQNVDFLVENFPKKMEIYTELERLGKQIQASFSKMSEQEQLFLKNIAQELDKLTESSTLLLRGKMLATQKMLDIIVFASQASQNELKVYDRQARVETNTPFAYNRR